MKKWKKILVVGGMCSITCALPAQASTNLETGSSLAGISVTLNNYYAGTTEPEKQLASSYSDMQQRASAGSSSSQQSSQEGSSSSSGSGSSLEGSSESASSGNGSAGGTSSGSSSSSSSGSSSGSSAYDNVAVSKVSGSVNIRTEANTSSDVTGKIYNDCAATILDTVEGEDGKWYKIKSGSVTGYIKAEYFVTGQQAEQKAKEVGTTYGTVVDTSSLRLRENPDLTSKTLTLLAEGAQYTVVGEEGDFLKVAVDTDLEGYVYKDYMKTDVKFREAVSTEEEKAREEEEAKRKKEAEKALRELEEAKKAAAAKKTTEATAKEETTAASSKAETTAAASAETETTTAAERETEKGTDPVVQTIATNPENGADNTVAAPTTEKASEAPTEKPTEKTTEATTEKATEEVNIGPAASDSGSSAEVTSATRNAIVAYAKQFLGNPYVYGGTSLTNGADCSGFTMQVYSHFGISTGRSSRDQAAKGKQISISDAKPGDLLFYASGNYINHVGIYIGGGQIIHASNPRTGICISPSNYRTPCKAVTFLD